MKYSSDGGFVVTLVGQNDLPHGMFAADGSLRVTTDSGLGWYAPNGAVRIGNEGSSTCTPSGGWNGTLTGKTFYPVSQGGRPFWDFESGDTVFDTFSRTGDGTAWTADGVLVNFAPDVPRVTTNGLLLEAASTNYLSNNKLPAAAARWSGAAAAPTDTRLGQTSEVANGPDGTATATRMTQRLAAGGSQEQRSYVVGISGTQPLACYSACLKYETHRYAILQSSRGNVTIIDLLNKAVVSGAGGLRAKADGWMHCYTPLAATTPPGHVPWLALFNGVSITFVGDGASSYLATLWQLELNVSVPSSPIITAGSQASRGADAATLKVPAGCTQWDAVYGDARTVVSGSGLTPGASFDLVAGRPWIGLGNELKNIRFKP